MTERLHLRVWIFYALIVFAALGVIAYAISSAVAVFRAERPISKRSAVTAMSDAA